MPSQKLKQNPMQGSLREIALEDGLRVASNALKYAERLVRNFEYPDTSAADFLLIRHLEVERDLNPCEDTQRALDEAIAVAQENYYAMLEAKGKQEEPHA